MQRETFMARIRAALEHDRTEAPREPAPVVDDAVARLMDEGDDLLEAFVRNAAAVGFRVQRLAADELLKTVGTLLTELKAKRVVVGVGTLPQALGLRDALRRRDIEVVDWKTGGDSTGDSASGNSAGDLASVAGRGRSPMDLQFDVDAGITDVHAALAETGSIICSSDAGHSRGLSLAPPVHIAIVRKSDILPDQIDFWRRRADDIARGALPSSMAIITGPSKTADIEGILITGVHGPGAVHLLVIGDA